MEIQNMKLILKMENITESILIFMKLVPNKMNFTWKMIKKKAKKLDSMKMDKLNMKLFGKMGKKKVNKLNSMKMAIQKSKLI